MLTATIRVMIPPVVIVIMSRTLIVTAVTATRQVMIPRVVIVIMIRLKR